MELWGFKFWSLVFPKFSVLPSSKTMLQTPKSFWGARMWSRSSITMPSLVGLRFHSPPGRPKTLSFLSVCMLVCLSVTLVNVRVCAPFPPVCDCAASVKFLPVADCIHCRRGWNFRAIDLTIWKTCLEFPFAFAASNSTHMHSSCCCLSTLSFFCASASSSWYRFLIFAFCFSVFPDYCVSLDIHFFFFCD